jgi:hypothetical protein
MSFTFLSAYSANHNEKKWNELFLFVQETLKENEELKEQNRILWKMLQGNQATPPTQNRPKLEKQRKVGDDDADEVTFLFEKCSIVDSASDKNPPLCKKREDKKLRIGRDITSMDSVVIHSWDDLDSVLTDDKIKKNVSIVSDFTIIDKNGKNKMKMKNRTIDSNKKWNDSEELKLVREVNEIIEKKITAGEEIYRDVIEEKHADGGEAEEQVDGEADEEQQEQVDGEAEEQVDGEADEEQQETVEEQVDDEVEEEAEEEVDGEEQKEEEVKEQKEEEEEEQEEVSSEAEQEEAEEQEDEEEEVEEQIDGEVEEKEEAEEEADGDLEEQEEAEAEEDEVEEIIYKGKKYYKDSSNTIYNIDADEEVGPEIGKFNPQTQTIEFNKH